jgi:2-keto-4-pentenoate hydratase
MDRTEVERAAAALIGARSGHSRLDALPAEAFPASEDDAYRIQEALVDGLGARPAGWKIGATSDMAQKMLGVGAPFAGRLLVPLIYDSPAEVPAGRLFMRGIEVEFAFRMGQGLAAAEAPFDQDAVAKAVAALHPAIEIIDSRYHDWLKAGGLQLIADNGCHGALVLGRGIEDWRGYDLAAIETGLWLNGEEVGTGSGRNVLGHPLAALTWLANHLAGRGAGLEAGEVVSTGSTCSALGWAEAGDRAEGRYGPLGTVEVAFT